MTIIFQYNIFRRIAGLFAVAERPQVAPKFPRIPSILFHPLFKKVFLSHLDVSLYGVADLAILLI